MSTSKGGLGRPRDLDDGNKIPSRYCQKHKMAGLYKMSSDAEVHQQPDIISVTFFINIVISIYKVKNP
jgi:hypothetical protein